MAEKGAHLTGTVYIRPSIFEIIAQESLASTLEPAFKKIFSFLVSFNPERYGYILEWVDEGYLIFNVLLQRYYLRKYSASFSETFYGLKRVTVVNSKLQEELSHKQQILSLILIVILPYLKNKLMQLNSKYKLQEINGCTLREFLSWWSQENYDMDIMSLPVPPPPKVSKVAQQYKGICPLCRKPHHIHTVLMISGYVFCYQCILSEIRIKKKCPITHYPAKEDDLIRLYIE
ncbi:PREDICTED: peroxisome assembly protein 12 isoform X2 [Wasmannia auropunctata]|uniref:peroxisome assembly protein 12 isoform X2 n=1 Tax=Wasmannia auropunctata TaxID=64793 RepID=UPI0005EF17B0|nr:PREDICTED: peroxisome assembly protein 12 isoform X2 [Wasmannia auropunctata]